MRRITTLVALLTAGMLAVVPATASAHKLQKEQAKAAATREAKQIAKETEARRVAVKRCRRKSRHAWKCTAVLRYRGGAVCKVPIKVAYAKKGHSGKRLRRERGATVCY